MFVKYQAGKIIPKPSSSVCECGHPHSATDKCPVCGCLIAKPVKAVP